MCMFWSVIIYMNRLSCKFSRVRWRCLVICDDTASEPGPIHARSACAHGRQIFLSCAQTERDTRPPGPLAAVCRSPRGVANDRPATPAELATESVAKTRALKYCQHSPPFVCIEIQCSASYWPRRKNYEKSFLFKAFIICCAKKFSLKCLTKKNLFFDS